MIPTIENMSNKKTIKYTFIALVAVLGVTAVLFYVFMSVEGSSNEPPASFTEARREAASTSQEIVQLTSAAISSISEVNRLVDQGRKAEAFRLIDQAEDINDQAHGKAFELSRTLQALTESLGEIGSIERIQIAYEAIATELSLVNEFLGYTEQLEKFLSDLRTVVGNGTPENKSRVSSSLRAVNAKIASINELNQEFLDKMREFDESF